MRHIVYAFLLISSFIVFNSYSQWITINSGVNYSLDNIFFVTEHTGYVTNRYNLLKTTNGGENWFIAKNFSTDFNIQSIYFLNENTGMLGGYTGSYPSGGIIIRTIDGGVNWIQTSPYSLWSYVLDINFIDNNTGFAFGGLYYYNRNSLMSKTTNGGNNWVCSDPLGSSRMIIESSFIDVNTGWVCVTENYIYGHIYKTTNSGLNWTEPYPRFSSETRSVCFVNSETGWLGGFFGIYKSTNGGNNWINQNSGTGTIWRIVFLNPTFGWAVGLGGIIKFTNNAGANWNSYTSITNNDLFSMKFIDSNEGWISGNGGIILHTTNNGGITGINKSSNIIPARYSLSQNYPNPFNPKTNIRFELPKQGLVQIKIYDLLGREVAILVNEKLNPGEYEVSWDGTNYPSGVYFYQLTVSSEQLTQLYRETKKMVLIK